MPTYEYVCKSCGEHLEVVQSFKDGPLVECPVCGGALRKVFGNIGIVFKGSGFYKTDNRSSSNAAKGAKAESESTATADAGSGGESTSAKPGSDGPGSKSSGSKGSESKGSGSQGSGSQGSPSKGSSAAVS